MGEKKEVSAIGYSVLVNVADNVQMTFQHYIASDASDEQVNADLDRIMNIVDRQRTLLEEPKLREELASLEASVKQYAADLEKVEADWQTAQNGRLAEIGALETQAKQVHDAAYTDHVISGRQGEFKPRGATEARLKGLASDVAKLKAAAETAEAERGQARQQLEIAMNARRGRIDMIHDKLKAIADLRNSGG